MTQDSELQAYLAAHPETRFVDATFLSKLFGEPLGSGLHAHASLIDAQGHNIFDGSRTGGTQRIKHRFAGAEANPYLVMAAVLTGMHHGTDDPDADADAAMKRAAFEAFMAEILPREYDWYV